jgi:opacity protein-like surface antigen
MKRLDDRKIVFLICVSLLIFSSYKVVAFENFYVGGIGGVLLTKDLAVNKGNLAPATLPPQIEITYKPGYKYGLFGGIKFTFVRAELEFSKLRSEAKEVVFQGNTYSLGGDVTTHILMGNGLLYFPGVVDLYGGAGIGYVSVDNRLNNSTLRLNKSLDNKKVGYQAIVGISIKLGIVNIFVDYRYIGTMGDVDALNKPYGNNTANAGIYFDIG